MLSFLTLATMFPSLRAGDDGPGLAALAFPSSCSFLGGAVAAGVLGARWLAEADASGLDFATRLALEGVAVVAAAAAAARAADDAVGRVSLSSRADEEGAVGVAAARAGVDAVVVVPPGVLLAGDAADGVAADVLGFAFVGVAAPPARADAAVDAGAARVRGGEALPGSGGTGDLGMPDASILLRAEPADDMAESGRARLAMLDLARAGVTGPVARDAVEVAVGADGEDGERTWVEGEEDAEADGGGDVMLARALASEDAVGVIARVETDLRREAAGVEEEAVDVGAETEGRAV
jgi:hypothetical protein